MTTQLHKLDGPDHEVTPNFVNLYDYGVLNGETDYITLIIF
jgi:hypothetical protein